VSHQQPIIDNVKGINANATEYKGLNARLSTPESLTLMPIEVEEEVEHKLGTHYSSVLSEITSTCTG
jgi:hypothetical protein